MLLVETRTGATKLAPDGGYDTPNGILQTLLTRKPTFAVRTPTRSVPSPTDTPAPPNSLPTGAIVGIAIGCAVGVGLIICVWFIIGRRVRRRRDERRTQRRYSEMGHPHAYQPSIASQQPVLSPPISYSGYSFPVNSPPPAELEVHNGQRTNSVITGEPQEIGGTTLNDDSGSQNIKQIIRQTSEHIDIPTPSPTQSVSATASPEMEAAVRNFQPSPEFHASQWN